MAINLNGWVQRTYQNKFSKHPMYIANIILFPFAIYSQWWSSTLTLSSQLTNLRLTGLHSTQMNECTHGVGSHVVYQSIYYFFSIFVDEISTLELQEWYHHIPLHNTNNTPQFALSLAGHYKCSSLLLWFHPTMIFNGTHLVIYYIQTAQTSVAFIGSCSSISFMTNSQIVQRIPYVRTYIVYMAKH